MAATSDNSGHTATLRSAKIRQSRTSYVRKWLFNWKESGEEEYIYTQIKRIISQRIENEKDFIIQINRQNFLKQLRKAQIEIVCEVEFDAAQII